MGFSKTAEYALRAMVEMARSGEAVTADDLAVRTQVPGAYLSKILRQLTRADFVHAVRGKNGGCRLSPHGEAATIYEVMQAVDPVSRIHACPLGLPEHREKLCPMHATIDAAFAELERTFRKARVCDLVDRSVSLESLLRRAEESPVNACHRRGRRPGKAVANDEF